MVGLLFGVLAPGQDRRQSPLDLRCRQQGWFPVRQLLRAADEGLEIHPAAVAVLQQLHQQSIAAPLQQSDAATTAPLGGEAVARGAPVAIDVAQQGPLGSRLQQVGSQQGV